jgi:RNA polymerase sigma-70 factor (ECF subfamily)
LSDAELVELTLKGAEDAFDELLAKYRPRVVSFCHDLVADFEEANDLAQEVFVEAYRSLPSLRRPGDFGSWIFGVAANRCKVWLRKRRRRRVFAAGSPAEIGRSGNDPPRPIEALERRDLVGRILDSLRALPPEYRIVAALRLESNLKGPEIAEYLGLPLATVKIRLHRAKKMIREQLARLSVDGGETDNVYPPNSGGV